VSRPKKTKPTPKPQSKPSKRWVCGSCGRYIVTSVDVVITPKCPNRFCTRTGTMKVMKGN
jgi:hypothetical protein